MNIFVSIVISALMVLGSLAYQNEHVVQPERLGASQTISSLTAKTTLQGSDLIPIVDESGTPTTKQITVTNATSSFKAYNDLQYSPIFSTSAGLASLLSDETGSGGGFVRATAPTISGAVLTASPALTTPSFDVAGTEATGDMLYLSNAGGTLSRLGIGASGDVMTVSAGLPSWGVFTGGVFSSTTFNATTTIMADNLLNRAFIINGLAYKWPSVRGAASSTLQEDGNGNLQWLSATSTSYASTTTSHTSTSATVIDTTFPTGFAPSVITIHWALKGSATAASYSMGVSTYSGTSLQGTQWTANNLAAASSPTQGTGNFTVDNVIPSAGASTGGSDIKVALSVIAATGTAVTVRETYTIAEGPTAQADYWIVAQK